MIGGRVRDVGQSAGHTTGVLDRRRDGARVASRKRADGGGARTVALRAIAPELVDADDAAIEARAKDLGADAAPAHEVVMPVASTSSKQQPSSYSATFSPRPWSAPSTAPAAEPVASAQGSAPTVDPAG